MLQGLCRRVALASLLLVLLGCRDAPVPPARVPLTIATGSLAGVYFPLGTSLARIYSARLPGVAGKAIQIGASVENVSALETGSADIAFALGDVAYLAYTEGTRLNAAPHKKLRSIAVLYANALHFIVPAASRIRSLQDVAHTRIAFGVATVGQGRSRSLDLMVQAHGVDPATVQAQMATFDEVVAGLHARTFDVGVISAGYPVPAIEAAARAGFRFLHIDPRAVERVRENYPFFFPITIPRDTYSAQSVAIETVGVDNVLLCREDLDEELVYRLTKELFAALPELTATHPSAGLIDADLAPATAIPLHGGAARYYRERELLLY